MIVGFEKGPPRLCAGFGLRKSIAGLRVCHTRCRCDVDTSRTACLAILITQLPFWRFLTFGLVDPFDSCLVECRSRISDYQEAHCEVLAVRPDCSGFINLRVIFLYISFLLLFLMLLCTAVRR